MPMLIKHIDAIAREKQRDVLYLTFGEPEDNPKRKPEDERKSKKPGFKNLRLRNPDYDPDTDWETLPVRKQIIDWMEANQISFQPCGAVADTNCMMPYLGQVYIDVPYDEADPVYQKLCDHLELADGSMRFAGVRFYVVDLKFAMKNAHHDEPGFWEKWAESF